MNVELISYTPYSEHIADVASSICVGKEPDGKSLKHAIGSGHDSVLEHVVFTFKISGISRACSHQLVRHRIASYSQQSQRYVGLSSRDTFDYVVPDTISDNHEACDEYNKLMRAISEIYGRLVDCYGIPQEDARYVLPNACSTELVMTMNARELRHFFSLRCCNRAQWEIRELAQRMLKICKDVAPVIFHEAGPSCEKYGICPEGKSCGKHYRYKDVMFIRKDGGQKI